MKNPSGSGFFNNISPFLSSEYKLRYRSSEEGSKAEEMYIKEFRSEDSEINAILKVSYLKIIFKPKYTFWQKIKFLN